MRRTEEEFYIGYLPRAPAGIAARVRAAVVALLVFAALLGLVLAGLQRPFGPGVFEFGVSRELRGVIQASPYPMLLVPRPGDTSMADPFSRYSLTVFGKRGANDAVAGYDGRAVSLQGSLIYRDGRTMVEIQGDTIQPLAGPEEDGLRALLPRDGEDLGTMTLDGEIVDSKCFLGVMKPGNLKPHRACAVRCISGGVPPVLVVRDSDDRATYFLLVSASGEAVNREVLDRVAEPVRIKGRVVRHGDLLVLAADPATYRRLTP